jgi:cytochrome c-type biogenesis protein CcmH/NrfG
LEARGLTAKPARLGQTKRLKVGEPVYAVGAPRGLELSLSDGIVSQLRGGPPPLIQTTAAISPGSSGGGLFDAEGRLVGFTTLYIEGGQSLNFAMPVEWAGEIQPGKKAAQGRSEREWTKRAIALESAQNWTRLRDWCQQWTQAQPGNSTGWFCLGGAYMQLQRHTESIEAYRQALRINPQDSSSWTSLGGVYTQLQRHTEAIDPLRQAIRIDPEDANAWGLLGIAYVHLQRYTEAIDASRQAIRINPGGGGWFALGSAYMRLRRYTEAIDSLRQAVRIDPKDANAWTLLAISYEGSGNRTAALETVRQLRRIDPARADELFNTIVPR